MNQDNSELITYLDNKFVNIDHRFDELKSEFSSLQTSVDNYSKKTDTYHQEMAVLFNKVHRMEEWIKKASAKLGIDFGL